MSREELMVCFQDTLDMSKGILGEATREAADSSRVYREGFFSNRIFALDQCRVDLLQCGVLEAAEKYAGNGRIAVLNAANPHFAGGGVGNGAQGPEERLCRRGNLYACLAEDRIQEEFYRYHKERTDYFFSDRVVYTKGVTIFKDAGAVPSPLGRDKWQQVDVISCAAPYLAKRRYTNRTVLGEILQGRIRNILETAIDNRAEILILNAFGCGVYANPPEIVARAFQQVFREHRYQGAFRYVIFAVEDPKTLGIFSDELMNRDHRVQAVPEKICLPGGKILRDAPECGSFLGWRRENPWYGKQFSVLGDSISTLDGFHPRGYRVFYQGQVCGQSGVSEMWETWWGKVIDYFGGELLVNDAWSGSTTARTEGQKDLFPSGCSPRRTGNLHIGNVVPDVILVYMGINDWVKGIPVTGPAGDNRIFANAYSSMLKDLRGNYPGAEIWCCTLGETYMRANPRFTFPSDYGGIPLSEYNRAITEAALRQGCRLLDIHSMGLPFDSMDGIHPTQMGMDTLGMLIVRCAAGETGGAFMDCPGGRHDNLELPPNEAGYRFVCRRCGREYVLPREDRGKIQLLASVIPCLTLRRKASGETLQMHGEQIFAGRSVECDLRLFGDYAARYQAEFFFRDGEWYVRDNQSKNGTYLNGTRLAPGQESRLKPGDEIAFAKMEAVVFCG